MLVHAGIALFIFGNRRAADGTLQPAMGVEEEFRLAAEAGLAVVPVGATGYMAAELHRRVLADFDRYYQGRRELLAAFEALGHTTDLTSLLEQIISFLNGLREDL